MSGLFSKVLMGVAVAGLTLSVPVAATSVEAASASSKARKAAAKRAKAKARSSSRNVGGYSYSYADSIIDFRDRSVFLDSSIDNPPGPFDSGFFFDSGIERQNDSPYLY